MSSASIRSDWAALEAAIELCHDYAYGRLEASVPEKMTALLDMQGKAAAFVKKHRIAIGLAVQRVPMMIETA